MTCSVAGCDRPRYALGYCTAHYMRLRRKGDPGGADTSRHPAGAVRYDTVHRRLRKDRGSAADRPCQDCGGAAVDWSYDHADPDELIDTRGLAYSLSTEHYVPRCRACHKHFDNARRRGLSWGGAP